MKPRTQAAPKPASSAVMVKNVSQLEKAARVVSSSALSQKRPCRVASSRIWLRACSIVRSVSSRQKSTVGARSSRTMIEFSDTGSKRANSAVGARMSRLGRTWL